MSIAILARKTKEKKSRKRCPQILNMTGRGGGIGRYHFNGKPRSNHGSCLGHNCKLINQGCCQDNMTVDRKYSKSLGCNYNGLSQPAPQVSYRTYLNRKSAGAYRPGSKICCNAPECKNTTNINTDDPFCFKNKIDCTDENGNCISRCKSQRTVKRTTPLTNEEITEIKKQEFERNYQAFHLQKCKCNDTTLHNPASDNIEQKRDNCREAKKWDEKLCCWTRALKYKSRLGYTRINNKQCTVTKAMSINNSASDVIQKRKASVYKIPCSKIDSKYPGRNIRTYCDCEQQQDWTIAQKRTCKNTLAKLNYPTLMNARQSVSEGCGGERRPCNIDGSFAISS